MNKKCSNECWFHEYVAMTCTDLETTGKDHMTLLAQKKKTLVIGPNFPLLTSSVFVLIVFLWLLESLDTKLCIVVWQLVESWRRKDTESFSRSCAFIKKQRIAKCVISKWVIAQRPFFPGISRDSEQVKWSWCINRWHLSPHLPTLL